jgi:hypothetical protein
MWRGTLHLWSQLSEAERNHIEQYSISDSELTSIIHEHKTGSMLKHSLRSEVNTKLKKLICDGIESIMSQHPEEQLTGIICCLDGTETLREIGREYGCDIIATEWSAIRKEGEYRHTLYYGNRQGKLAQSDEGRQRYEQFLREGSTVPFFTREELLAIFIRDSALPLIPLARLSGQREITVCSSGRGCGWNLPNFVSNDSDLLQYCYSYFGKEQVVFRDRPTWITQSTPLDMMMINPNPIPSLLECRRTTAVGSNTLMDAMLWGRTACVVEEVLSFDFLCEKDFTSTNLVDNKAVNYLLFGFFVPNMDLLFSPAYWDWRLSNPSETEIYLKHQEIVLSNLGITPEIINISGSDRLTAILESRDYSQPEIERLLSLPTDHDPDYSAPLVAQLVSEERNYYCLNRKESGQMISSFSFIAGSESTCLTFKPFTSENILARVISYTFSLEDAKLEHVYSHESLFDYCPAVPLDINIRAGEKVDLSIIWEYKPIEKDTFLWLINQQKELHSKLHTVLESKSWRITKPLRALSSIKNR